MFSVLNVVEAWNQISWEDAIPFTLVLIGLYWVKVKIDASVGISGKKGKQLKRIIREVLFNYISFVATTYYEII